MIAYSLWKTTQGAIFKLKLLDTNANLALSPTFENAMPQHDSRAIANRLLDIADSNGIPVTIMQLVKLLFLADGWNYALNDYQLSTERAKVWQFGPVYPKVYKCFPGSKASQITSRCIDVDGNPYSSVFSPNEEKVLENVVKAYGKMHAFQLSELTHSPGSPWERAYREGGLYSSIPPEWSRDYFRAISTKTEEAHA